MKRQNFIMICSIFLLISCGNSEANKLKKKIIQKYDADYMGSITLKNLMLEKENDSTYQVTFEMRNPLTQRDLKAIEIVNFTKDLDSIKNIKRIKTYIKSEGEFVEMGD